MQRRVGLVVIGDNLITIGNAMAKKFDPQLPARRLPTLPPKARRPSLRALLCRPQGPIFLPSQNMNFAPERTFFPYHGG